MDSNSTQIPTVKMWSPSNPKELIVLNTETGSSTSLIVAEKEHEDCNAFERQALRSLIDIAESRTVTSSPLEISKEYRNAVCLCLEEWTDEETDAAPSSGLTPPPIELVQLDHTCHTLQLAEIFLPLHDYQSPALVTADTVRYLRNQHSRLPFAMDSIEIRRELQHPYAMDRPCFWENMTVAVITGRLFLATELLLKLPLIANVLSMMDETDERAHPREEQGRLLQEVWNLVTMFRKAPIPGSPFDNKDDGLSMHDETSMDESELNFGDVHRSVAYLDSDAYLQWESTSSVFSPPGASRALQHWQQTLQQLQFSVLFKHFAPLQELVSMACGSSAPMEDQAWEGRPWWDTVLCQIIYQTPTLKPHDLINRITSLVERTNDEWIVPILEGEGSVALEEIIINRTTSPLPGALRALWFGLCVGWKALAKDEETQTELVCGTAESIVVNHVDTPDAGMQLATRWIVLHALQSKSRVAFESYTGFLAALLENHIPSTEEYAMTLLRYCEPLFMDGFKSIPIVESCVDILRFVFQRHIDSLDFESASTFLAGEGFEARENFKAAMRVMETALGVEITVYGEKAAVLGRVHGFLDRFCLDTCQSMLEVLADPDGSSLDLIPIAQAKGLLEVCSETPSATILPGLSYFQELEAIFMLYAVRMDETSPAADDVGEALANCLAVCGSKYQKLHSLLVTQVQTTLGESERGSTLGDGALDLLHHVHEDASDAEEWALLHTEATNRYIIKSKENWA